MAYIYLITNESYPDFCRIVCTDTVGHHLQELNSNNKAGNRFKLFARYEIPRKLEQKELYSVLEKLLPGMAPVVIWTPGTRPAVMLTVNRLRAYAVLVCIAEITGTTDRLHRYTVEY